MLDTLKFIEKFASKKTESNAVESGSKMPAFFRTYSGGNQYHATDITPLESGGGSGNLNVTFIVARGATGKTALSQEISRALHVPLWNTAIDRTIGAYSLQLHLTKYWNVVDPLETAARLEFPLVVIDGVDEAQSRVSAESWEDFKASLVEFAKQGMRFIILGRELAIFDIASEFELVGEPGSIYELQPFNHGQATNFLDARFQILSQGSESQITSTYYGKCKEIILTAIEKQLRHSNEFDESAIDQFLGYAPVLEAIAIKLSNHKNIAALAQELENTPGLSEQMLFSVVQTILDREAEKAPLTFRNYESEVGSVFGHEEQISLIFFRMGLGLEPLVPVCIPHNEEAGYRDFRDKQIEDHPFVISGKKPSWASKVFEGYALLYYHGQISHRRDLVTLSMKNPLLFSFALISSEELLADEWFVSALHASMVAFEGDAKDYLEGGDFQRKSVAQITYDAERGANYSIFTSRFNSRKGLFGLDSLKNLSINFLQEELETLNFYGPLEQLIIDVPQGTLNLKPLDRVPYIGPNLIAHADTVILDAQEARLRRKYKSTSGLSRIVANRVNVSLPRIPDFKEDEFINPQVELSASNTGTLPYPWNLFTVVQEKSMMGWIPNHAVYEVVDRLDRLVAELKRLKPQGKKKIGTDRAGWCARVGVNSSSTIAHEILGLLNDNGVIKEENGQVFYIDDPELRPLFSTIFDVPPNSSRVFSSLDEAHRENWYPIIQGLVKVHADNGTI